MVRDPGLPTVESLRHWMRDAVASRVPVEVRVAIRRGLRRRRSASPGPPPGLDLDMLADVCAAELGAQPASVSHLRLSGWRDSTTGAYRVFVETAAGDQWRCVFKNSELTVNATPGLGSLPAIPGSEYLLYSEASPSLDVFLPRRLFIEELEPGVSHRVLMEDLATSGFRALVNDEDVLHAVRSLPEWHAALSDWASASTDRSLYRYDPSFSDALRTGCRSSLELFQRGTPDSAVGAALDAWGTIEAVHTAEMFYDPVLQSPVHGDANRANLLWNGDEIRIVDWEWAGWRLPHFDLASLLKGRGPELTKRGVELYSERCPDRAGDLHEILHLWARLEIRLLDAAYVIGQEVGAPGVSSMDSRRYIHVSAKELLDSATALSSLLGIR